MIRQPPTKTLKCSCVLGEPVSYITDKDELWVGNPKSWKIKIKVEPQSMSYPGIRNDYTYDGRDINVTDWVSDASGTALQITEILSAKSNVVEAIVEDIELENTYIDSSGEGDGSIENGLCFIFEDKDAISIILNTLRFLSMTK